jgi:6-methylsalicylate decarboxylase
LRTDIHQHLWPEPFLQALRARAQPPRMDGWRLELFGESWDIDPAAHDVPTRVAKAALDGLDLVCVAPSAALGIDRLAPAESRELAEAWLEGALALPPPFRVWAAAPADRCDAEALSRALARGAIGMELAAGALAAPDALEDLAPLLDVLDVAGCPLLVHPGPTHGDETAGRPAWWGPVVPYVSGLHAAWWAWADGGRERFPRLPVVFAALAGLGPLHGERQRARGGEDEAVDLLTFVETSSYGTLAVDAVVRVLGIDVVCHGSDRPYATPGPLVIDGAAVHAIHSVNPARLLAGALQEVPA